MPARGKDRGTSPLVRKGCQGTEKSDKGGMNHYLGDTEEIEDSCPGRRPPFILHRKGEKRKGVLEMHWFGGTFR